MDPVRIAVIGAGVIGKRHITLIQKNPQCRLVAICDPALEVKQLVDQLNIPFFQDYIALLEQVTMDGAIIATPTDLHGEVGIACAERGIYLLVEKPIIDTVENGQVLLSTAN